MRRALLALALLLGSLSIAVPQEGFPVPQAYTGPTSWTPAVAFGGGTTGVTYTTQQGTITQYGKITIAAFRLTLSAKGSSTGSATITGIPIAAQTAGSAAVFSVTCGFYNGMGTITAPISGYLSVST